MLSKASAARRLVLQASAFPIIGFAGGCFRPKLTQNPGYIALFSFPRLNLSTSVSVFPALAGQAQLHFLARVVCDGSSWPFLPQLYFIEFLLPIYE